MALSPAVPSLSGLPAFRVLSNGDYCVLAHGRGAAFSRFRNWALNDWVWDGLSTYGGMQVYVQDRDTGQVTHFDLGAAPVAGLPCETSGDALVWQCRQQDLQLTVTLSLAAQQPLELRELRLRNQSAVERRLAVTLFVPIALNDPVAHDSHPAFSKLFVQTEFDPATQSLLAWRRPRGSDDPSPCLFARLEGAGELNWESDRIRFIGRGCSLKLPHGVLDGLTQRHSNVLDPCFALQRSFELPAAATHRLQWTMGATENRTQLNALLALQHSQLPRAKLQEQPDLETLLGALYHHLPQLKPAPAHWRAINAAQGNVWGYGIATDRPFVLLMTANAQTLQWAQNTAQYWQGLGIPVPVLALTRGIPALSQNLIQHDLDAVPTTDLLALQAAAALVCGELAPPAAAARTAVTHTLTIRTPELHSAPTNRPALQFENHFGGFSADGHEYVINIQASAERLRLPPMPWINVLANPRFGCLVSETGAGCTWSVNSHERRLTPWANDPVRDHHEEAFYLHEAATGLTWSPLPGPLAGSGEYEVQHGWGYSCFSTECEALQQRTQVFVHPHLPVKIWRIHIRNNRNETRLLSLTAAQRLVLGFLPQQASYWLDTEPRANQRLLVARNPLAGEMAPRIAFASAVGGEIWKGGCDRHALFGDSGDLTCPVGLLADWSTTPAAGDAAFIQQLQLTVPPQAEISVNFLLGDAADETELETILQTLATDTQIAQTFEQMKTGWQQQVTAIQVQTPSSAINLMLNGWLIYQTLACRLWGRTAFYQSSGAYGFRDQLQDSGALTLTFPELTRQQILLHASRQFVEGDVQHWWHEPPIDSGLRTRFSDDLNWLPFLTAHYISTTGDKDVLDCTVPFLEGPLLAPDQDEAFARARTSNASASLYEHCCRALDRSLTKGDHGLPLIGTGDWNDGMNRVGRAGKGESVWMAFFLYTILADFIPIAEQRGDHVRADNYRDYRDHLARAANDAGWDGRWYRRAYYDNGDPLGSAQNDECRIDALAQSWAVLSGIAPPERARMAIAATEAHLIDRSNGLIRLLTPAFVNTRNDPGYIKGYVAGVRENGGQYTHAATWVVQAMAAMGRADCTAALFEMLLPVTHTQTAADVERFQAEPYVAVADIYGEPPHVGRGGWSWYTGSSGWLYRVGIESLLGLTLRDGNRLYLQPCIPVEWPEYSMQYRLPQGGVVHLLVQRRAPAAGKATGNTVVEVVLNGNTIPVQKGGADILLVNMQQNQNLRVVIE